MSSDGGVFKEFTGLTEDSRERLDELYSEHFLEVGKSESQLKLSERSLNSLLQDISFGIITAIIAGLFGWVGLAGIGVLTVVVAVVMSLYQTQVIDAASNTKTVDPFEHEQLYNAFVQACDGVGIDPNTVTFKVSELGMSNAVASGSHRYVMISNDLIELLEEDELIGILQHELSHIKSGDGAAFTKVALPAIAVGAGCIAFAVVKSALVVGAVACVVSVVSGSILRYRLNSTEISADKNVSDEFTVPMSTGLLKLGMGKLLHVESKAMLFLHAVLDPHPPLNKRLEYILGSGSEKLQPPVKSTQVSVTTIFSTVCSLVSSFLVTLSFLSIVSNAVSPSIAFYGVLVFGLGVLSKTDLFPTADQESVQSVSVGLTGIGMVTLAGVIFASVGLLVAFIFGINSLSPVEILGVGVMSIVPLLMILPLIPGIVFMFLSGDFKINRINPPERDDMEIAEELVEKAEADGTIESVPEDEKKRIAEELLGDLEDGGSEGAEKSTDEETVE